MKYFYAIVHKDPDSAYGVTFPDLPGCHSAADGLDDVLANATEAMELWLEDQPEPEGRSVQTIRDDVADDLAAGAFLLAVPRMTVNGKLARVNVSFDMGTLAAIDAAAGARKLTRSARRRQETRCKAGIRCGGAQARQSDVDGPLQFDETLPKTAASCLASKK